MGDDAAAKIQDTPTEGDDPNVIPDPHNAQCWIMDGVPGVHEQVAGMLVGPGRDFRIPRYGKVLRQVSYQGHTVTICEKYAVIFFPEYEVHQRVQGFLLTLLHEIL